tara:strand:- start:4347 stop:5093 length:747 start_codon:yes stop_codon:yes gene_type:complete
MARINITGRNTRENGTKLNSGLDTMSDFNLVTAVENKEFSHNVRMRFQTSSGTTNDYLSDFSHISQFDNSASSIISSGSSYDNKWAANFSQVIAPYDCFLKSVDGYISPTGLNSCELSQDIHISIWMKDVTVGGTSSTAVNQLFTQKFTFASGLGNNYALKIDGTTDSQVNNSSAAYKISSQKAIIVSVRRSIEEACGNFTASFNLVFQAKDSSATTEDFKFQTISVANGRYDVTLSNPDKSYIPFAQ